MMNMNKYQLEFWKYLTLIEDETDNKLETFSIENEKIKINQNKNYNIKKKEVLKKFMQLSKNSNSSLHMTFFVL